MKKFLTALVTWGVIATASYGFGYLSAKMIFHLNFTTKVVNPVPMQGREFELANKLDQVVLLTAESAEETSAKAGGVVGLLTVGVFSSARAIDDIARKNRGLRSRYQSLLGRVASMKRAYNSNDMDGFTTIATTLVQESDDDSVS